MSVMLRAGFAALILPLSSSAALAQDDAGYATRLPTGEQVAVAYPDAARQAVACGFMEHAVELMLGNRQFQRNRQTDAERARLASYQDCISNRRLPDTATQDEQRAFEAAVNATYNEAFRAEVLDRFFPRQDRATLNRRLARDKLREERDKAIEERAAAKNSAWQAARDARAATESRDRLATAVLLLLVALILLWSIVRAARWLKPLQHDAGSMQFSAGGPDFVLDATAGVLARLETERHITHTPGTETRDQYGNVVHRTSGSSVTTTYQTLFIIDDTGSERACQLMEFGVIARPGNLVGVIDAGRKGGRSAAYVHCRNFTLGQGWTSKFELRRLLGLGLWPGLALFFGGPVLGFAIAVAALGSDPDTVKSLAPLVPILAISGLIAYIVMSLGRMRQFKERVLPSALAYAERMALQAQERGNGPVSRAD